MRIYFPMRINAYVGYIWHMSDIARYCRIMRKLMWISASACHPCLECLLKIIASNDGLATVWFAGSAQTRSTTVSHSRFHFNFPGHLSHHGGTQNSWMVYLGTVLVLMSEHLVLRCFGGWSFLTRPSFGFHLGPVSTASPFSPPWRSISTLERWFCLYTAPRPQSGKWCWRL